MGAREQRLCELYAIVGVDARPLLAVLALAQAALPSALRVTGDLLRASFRFRDAHRVELEHCKARVDTRTANVSDLRRHQVPAPLAQAFLGVPSERTGVALLRLELGEMIALVHPQTCHALVTHPDSALVDWRLPAADELLPGLPQSPRPRPQHLMVRELASLPDRVDGSELRSLYIPDCRWLGPALEVLGPLPVLRELLLGRAGDGQPADLARLPLAGIEIMLLDDLDGAEDALCAALPDAMATTRLRLKSHQEPPLRLLAQIADRAPLRALELSSRALARQPPGPEWAALWSRPIAWQSLRLHWPDAHWLAAVLAAPLDQLVRLGVACTSGTALADALGARRWPQLRELDLVDSAVTGEQLQALVAGGTMPRLERVGISLRGEEIEDWTDWNGAVVGSGPRTLFPHEIEKRYLAGSGVRVGDIEWRW